MARGYIPNYGGGSAGSDEVTATTAQVLPGVTAITSDSNDEAAEGTMPTKAAQTYDVAPSTRTIAAGQYLTGGQTIRAVTTEGIAAANVKKGVAVKVGDADDDDRIAGVTGTYTGVLSSGQTAMAAGQLLTGYSGFVNGSDEIKGSMADKAGTSQAATVDADTTNNRVRMKIPAAGYYSAASYLYAAYSSFGNATAAQVLKNRTFTSSAGLLQSGTIESKAAATYNTYGSDREIAAGVYLSGKQTIKAVTTAGIAAANIKKGVAVKVGDANDDDRIAGVTGTYTTVSSGQSAVTAAALRSGYSGFANGGSEVKGSMADLGAGTYYATTSDQSILTTGRYVNVKHTIKKLTQTNLAAANILRGKTITINNGNANVWSVTGSSSVLKCVSGEITSGITSALPGGPDNKKYHWYSAKVNPGITPVMAFCLSSWGFVRRAGAKIASILTAADVANNGYYTNFSGDWSSSSVEVFAYDTNTSISYWIFGY